jgi:GNAT superfamily N-acetyltransferase
VGVGGVREGSETMGPSSNEAAQIEFRSADEKDFDYCAKLYFAGIEPIIERLKLNRAAQVADFHRRWDPKQVQIVTRDGIDVGWFQTATSHDAIFLAQIFVEPVAQNQGIGTEVMHRLIKTAKHAGKAVTLGVVKSNPARRLYERLGFRIMSDDDRKFYMRLDP